MYHRLWLGYISLYGRSGDLVGGVVGTLLGSYIHSQVNIIT